MMDIADLQRAIGTAPDGYFGPESRKRFLTAFINLKPAPIGEEDFALAAYRLRCSPRQMAAVRHVEGATRGFDRENRVLMLFERHRFYQLTGGAYGITPFSHPEPGGYDLPSWDLMMDAIATGAVDAALATASWGLFQVRGHLWSDLGYASPWAMARAAAVSEAEQLVMLCGYLERSGLAEKLRAISGDPRTCRAFAEAYNGIHYRSQAMDKKLAEAMRAVGCPRPLP